MVELISAAEECNWEIVVAKNQAEFCHCKNGLPQGRRVEAETNWTGGRQQYGGQLGRGTGAGGSAK